MEWVRMDFLWQDIEPQQGAFDFKKDDQIVAIARAQNIQILGLLNYSAAWASENGQWNFAPRERAVCQ